MQHFESTIERRLLKSEELDWLAIGEDECRKARARALLRVETFDLSLTLNGAIDRHVRAGGADSIAVCDRERRLSYAQLLAEIKSLATKLTLRLSDPRRVIAVAGDRCSASVVAFLAIERVGGIYLPIDQHWPALRIQNILEASAASTLLFTGSCEAPASLTQAAVRANCPIFRASDDGSVGPPDSEVRVQSEDAVRYVLYTSGSTGQPKGAVIEQQGMMNHLWAKVVDLRLSNLDCVAQTAPLTFDISIWQMLAALLVGGRVVFLDDEDVVDPDRLIHQVGANNITVLEVVPTGLRFLLDERASRKAPVLESLHCLIATGEVLPPSIARRWTEEFPNVPLVNAYGPTECSDDVAHYTVPLSRDEQVIIPIGSPVPNADLYILREDEHGFRACEYDEIGELFVGGVCVGRGYLADAGRTRLAFFRDPFADTSTGRLYRTGDLVRRVGHDVLEYVGRIDRQVKVGGVRIELGEIEATICKHPAVSAAAVVVYAESNQNQIPLASPGKDDQRKRLIAYVCGKSLDTHDLNKFLTERLPYSMVPHEIVCLSELPLTANGKIDYSQLQIRSQRMAGRSASRVTSRESVSIGRPIANTRMYILDRYREPVAVGVTGEIYIGGIGVARGYLNRPDLTNEQFIESPFVPGDRLYRTGDLARHLSDGRIELLGRNDFQVRIRGFKIDLGEIEAHLRTYPGVAEAMVIAHDEEGSGDRPLVAYYVSQGGASVVIENLRGHLLDVLPRYMVPAEFVHLNALPRTPNGEIDRRAPNVASDVAQQHEPPLGDMEQIVARIWQELLGVDRVGRRDNFFSLGGHSLLAARVRLRLQRELAIDVGFAELFMHPELSDLARAISESKRGTLPVMAPIARGESSVLSFAQQRLWFLSQFDAVSKTYNIPLDLRLRGDLDKRCLRDALDALIARHETLRTTFSERDGEPVQHVSDVARFSLVEHDLRFDLNAVPEFERLRIEEVRGQFDLEAGPLIRGRLVQLKDAEHALLITMHHIVSDGWSMGILLRELGALYGAHREKRPAELPELNIQYADYAAWQREHFGVTALQDRLAYWKEALEGIPEVHQLPTDHARPEQQDFNGASLSFTLNSELTERVRSISLRHGATMFQTLLAAWGIVFSRLSNQDDIVIGIPVANRSRAEVEGLVGFFVNTMALRLDLSDDPTVGKFLDRVRRQAVAAQEHQEVPFEQVVEALAPPRSLAHTPVFQVLFAWQSAEANVFAFPGLDVQTARPALAHTKFDVTIGMAEAGDVIAGSVEYATALFERSTIERYVEHLSNVLAAMAVDDGQPVTALPLLTDFQRGQVLRRCASSDSHDPVDDRVHELFEAWAAETPGAVALTYEDAKVTYAELNARANKVARYLRSLGVKPDDRVALCAERSVEMIVGILAVLKAGAGYVPLDPSYPPDRLRFMLADSAPVAVLTYGAVSEPVRESLDSSEVRVVDLQADAAQWAGQSPENVVCGGLTPQHLAYVIYTSGTSGQPKGVMVEHANVVRLFGATEAWFRFSASDVWTLFHSAAFDFSVWEMWGALLYGGRLVIVPHAVTRSPEEFYKVVCTEGVTVLNQTPSAFRQLLAAQRESGATHCLRTMIFGGEALDPATLAPWYADARNAGVALVNMYGITETTVHVTYQPIGAEHLAQPGRSPIGQRIPDLSVYILDVDREPVPTGVVGELYVGGAGVARGYLNRPDLTAERFIASPFVAGERLYKTGDLARYLSDDTIEYLGRNDSQVKIRGFRIELGEIEARLMQSPAIEHAVVLAREDSPGERRLVAYYVASGRELVQVESLRMHLQKVLPEYMIPAAYVRLEALPLTANGKLDRKLLPAPESSAYAARMYEAPDGDVEQRIARIWSEVLGVEHERIGRHDNFFELGGHSLMAVRVLSRMRAVGLYADVRSIYKASILADFCACAKELVEIRL